MVWGGFSSFWLYQYQVCLFADLFPFCCLKELVLLFPSPSSEPLGWGSLVCLSVTILKADCWHFNSSFSFSSLCTVIHILFSSSDPAEFFRQNWLSCVKGELAAVRAELAASHTQSLCIEQQVQLLLFCLLISVKVASFLLMLFSVSAPAFSLSFSLSVSSVTLLALLPSGSISDLRLLSESSMNQVIEVSSDLSQKSLIYFNKK